MVSGDKGPGQKLPELTPDEVVRYGRHLAMPEIGQEGQRKLKASSVLVVGVGGLGNSAAAYLAAAGVGRIGIADGDIIEKSNLHRQFLYSEPDIGRNKAEVATSRLQSINPHVEVEPIPFRIDSSNGLGIVGRYDIVVDGTDNLPTRYLVNDACVLLGKPDVYASVLKFDAQASVFYPPAGPCYRCLFPVPPPAETVQDCADVGVLGAVTGIMGSIQAVQALSLLTGIGSPLVGRLLIFDGLAMSFEEIRIKRSNECAVCGPNPSVMRLIDYGQFCGTQPPRHDFDIEPKSLKTEMANGSTVLLLDVREPYEYGMSKLENSKLIPLGKLRSRMGEMDKNANVVVYCHHGFRSAVAVNFLRGNGFRRVRNLRGGIEAWSLEVDPSTPRY